MKNVIEHLTVKADTCQEEANKLEQWIKGRSDEIAELESRWVEAVRLAVEYRKAAESLRRSEARE